MSQVFFVVQQSLVDFFPPYIFNSYTASHLWFLAMIESRNSKYHKRRLGVFYFFPLTLPEAGSFETCKSLPHHPVLSPLTKDRYLK